MKWQKFRSTCNRKYFKSISLYEPLINAAVITIKNPTVIISSILAFYHFGIEQGLFSESFVCESNNFSEILTKEQILEQLKQNSISCKDVSFKILGLSLASINTIFSIILSVIFIKLFINYGKN